MNSSSSIVKIAAALVKAQGVTGNAKKDATNPFFKKNYADLNAVREAVMPSLNANGICVLQPPAVIDGVDYVETVLLHESGEYISSLTRIVVDKASDAQRHGSGLSYARRYALQSMVCIGAEDDDANGATGKNNPAPAATPPPKAFKPTKAQWDEANSLIKDSTLDDNQKAQTSNYLTNATTKEAWDKCIAGLRTKQSV